MSSVVTIVLKSIILGGIGGFAIAAGAARMFHAPDKMGMGAFRTLGEINANKGDAISHASFGGGFFLSSAAASIASGSLTQDILHRVIPNFAAALLATFKRKNASEMLKNPLKMGLAGAVVGMICFTVLNTVASVIPADLAKVAGGILAPASKMMIEYIMPLLFLWAAFDAGKTVGITSIILAGLMQLITGNALPGAVLGILLGYMIQENGLKERTTQVLLIIVIVILILIAYFRKFDVFILKSLGWM